MRDKIKDLIEEMEQEIAKLRQRIDLFEGEEVQSRYVNRYLAISKYRDKLKNIYAATESESRDNDVEYPEKKVPKNMGYGKGGDIAYI
jgi:hypothetical protein